MKIAFLEIEDNQKYEVKNHKILNIKENINQIDLNLIKDCKILSCKSKSRITKEILENLPNLKYIMTRTVGIDHIDLEYAKEKNILVSNIPNYGSHAIAEHVFALLLTGMRNIIKANNNILNGNFSFHGLKGDTLKNKTLGVIGTGKIGEDVIKIGKGFCMEVICYDIIKKEGLNYVSLEELLEKSDIITLHLPSTSQTRHIINKDSINKMKEGVILINTARGDLIDTKDLIELHNKFSFIGLDVLEDEKDFSDKNEILKLKNILITPHIAFYTKETFEKIKKITLENINSFIKKAD